MEAYYAWETTYDIIISTSLRAIRQTLLNTLSSDAPRETPCMPGIVQSQYENNYSAILDRSRELMTKTSRVCMAGNPHLVNGTTENPENE